MIRPRQPAATVRPYLVEELAIWLLLQNGYELEFPDQGFPHDNVRAASYYKTALLLLDNLPKLRGKASRRARKAADASLIADADAVMAKFNERFPGGSSQQAK